jgi:FkbM family methyltransferase
MKAKTFVRSAVRRFGLDITRFSPAASDDARLVAMLAAHGVNVVFDVGANTGQFGEMLRAAGYAGRIVSFEPLSAARAQLAQASNGDAKWEIAEQAAIGDADGEITIHISGNSVSSSVLDMLNAHSEAAPESKYIGSESVPLRRLDRLAPQFMRPDSVAFLKIDTQGYEDRVLRGGAETIAGAIGLQLEMSLVSLYEGQRHFDELYAGLKQSGFELWGMSPAFVDPRTGRLLQIDATFFRTPASRPAAAPR